MINTMLFMKDFHSLTVWRKVHDFVLKLYPALNAFPDEERFGVCSQLRRAAVSIPSNLAEGCGSQGDAEMKRFFQIAMGSASEVEYQSLLSKDLNYIHPNQYSELNSDIAEIKRMLNVFIQKLKPQKKS